jgi:hypothetical protein
VRSGPLAPPPSLTGGHQPRSWRIWLHDDQTVQLIDATAGVVLTRRMTIHLVGQELDRRGCNGDDLRPE